MCVGVLLVPSAVLIHSTTMNMDEAVAKGCAFTCAMLSPLFQVKEVQVTEYVLYPIKVSWDIKGASSAGDGMDVDGEPEESKDNAGNTLVVFNSGTTYPSTKSITFKSAEVRLCPTARRCSLRHCHFDVWEG